MDFKELRDKILPNIELYNKEEVKIVVAKLLEFLIDIDEKNKALEKEIIEVKNEVKEKVIIEKEKVNLEEVNKEKEVLLEKARNEAQKAYDEIIQEAINKVQNLIKQVKQKDEQNKMYRKHILSIFRRSIFRFSNTNYYIFKTDDEEFQELIKFFQVDEELQKLCDENIKKLMQDEKYRETIHKVEANEIEETFEDIEEEKEVVEEIVNEEIEIKEVKEINEIEIKEFDINKIEEISIEDIEEELNSDIPQKKAKFLDILNQYKNK